MTKFNNIQQRIYVLESMARQGEATNSNMKELFKLQTKLERKQYLDKKYGPYARHFKIS
jgi:hypothetical protein